MSGEEQSAESKYEVREVIGKGAFGEVNLVVEKQSKQRFVLKRIKMARQSEWQRKATRQEIEIVSRLRHPFIMPYKEHWTHHGHTINVVYGYCEKGDLTSAITKQKGKYFPEETLRLWLAELLLAVDYMHRQNVLHRDIKTQNILLTGDGDVQIGDFGLSTVRVPSLSDAAQHQPGGDDTDPRMDSSPAHLDVGEGGTAAAATPEPATKGGGNHHAAAMAHVPASHVGAEAYTNGLANAHANGHNGQGDKERDQLAGHTPVHDPKAGTRNDYALVGTPHFMSPELLSSQKYSYETDIWSLGVVMYELTTLKPPFNAFNLAGLVAKIKRAALPPIPSTYSAEWTGILKSMLRKDPTRRASPLELLAIPYMKDALQQARQRALAISPDFVMPALPVLDIGVSSGGFCFNVVPGGAAAGAGAGGGVSQRTPTAAGPSTPLLINPLASVADEAGSTEAESSPLSKFPDLGAPESPLPPGPGPSGAAAVPAAAATSEPVAGGATVDATGSKNPATARRLGGPGAAALGAAAVAAANAKRAVSPQRARAPPVFGGAQRSKTPNRALGGAAVTAGKADVEPNGRVVRKPSTTRESRPRSLVNASPRDLSNGGAVPASVRAPSPTEAVERPAGRRAGPNSGPAPRVSAVGGFRAGNTRRSVLDAIGGAQQQAAAVAAAAAVISVPGPTAHDIDAGETASFGSVAASAGKVASPLSTGGHKSPAGAAAAQHAADGGVGRLAARPVRSISVNTTRTSRSSLTAGSSPPQASPTGIDTAVHGHHHNAGAKRPVSAARVGSTDFTGGVMAAHPKRAAAAVSTCDGSGAAVRRPSALPETGAAMASARSRNTSSPMNRSSIVSASVNGPPAVARRRSQPGTAVAATAAGKEAADAAALRLPEKRVRRSSYVSYGKPADSAPLQRRPTSHAHPPLLTAREAAPAAAAPSRTVATAGESEPLSSHPLAASEAAIESCPAPASCSPVGEAGARSLEALDGEIAPRSADAPGAPGDVQDPISAREEAAAPVAVSGGSGAASGDQAEAAAGAGGAAAGAGHPWRQTPRSRSLMSMTTEDSELSIPDGSSRYGPSEANGSVYDGDGAGGGAAAGNVFPVTASPGRPHATAIVANAVAQPLWSCNQLYSGSYGSCAGSITDISAPGVQSAGSGALAPLASGGGSGRGTEAAAPVGGTPTLAADLPRRVSASVFAPHLLGSYGRSATAALAAAPEDAVGTESGASTSMDGSRGATRMGLRRLTINESAEAGGAGVSPSRFDPVTSSPATGDVPESSSPLSSTATSPYAGGVMEIVSPMGPPPRRRAPAVSAGDSPAGQNRPSGGSLNAQQLLQQRRSGKALDARGIGVIGGVESQSYMLHGRQSADASLYDTSPLGSTASAVKRALTQQHDSAEEASEAAAAAAVPGDSCSEVTSHLRPVAEDVDGEAESSAPQPRPGLSTASEPSPTERSQLALLQRVVALAGSLWEMGRDEELGAVLSSTLSRALVRRPGAAAATTPLANQRSGASEQSMRQQRAPEPGDAVRVTAGPLKGTEAVVRYRGPCHWGAGTMLGLELPHASAASAGQPAGGPSAQEPPGSRDGVRYFRCHQPGHGAAFVEMGQVAPLE